MSKSKSLYYFYGEQLSKDRMTGWIESKDLIAGLTEDWFPYYQRERVKKSTKVNELISIFKDGRPIDGIKLNFIGDIEKDGKASVLDGAFHVIDGQQRLRALKDSGVQSYRMPIELYINFPIEEEVALFHQFNAKGTKLSFGEFAKSYDSLMADLVRSLMKKTNYVMPISLNSAKTGLTLSTYCKLLYWVHRRMIRKSYMKTSSSTTGLKRFLQQSDYTAKEVEHTEFATRAVLEQFVELFGEYDMRAMAYRAGFFLPLCHVIVDNFLTDLGKIHFRKFSAKASALPQLLKSSLARELLEGGGGGGHDSHSRMYDLIIEYFNNKLKGNRLQTLHERYGLASDDEEELRREENLAEEEVE